MSRPVRYLLVIATLALMLAGCGLVPPVPKAAAPAVVPNLLKHLTVGGVNVVVEVASTDAAREQGLSDRVSLPPGQGMLFVFESASEYEFWMNRMRFPLDFLWLQQGVITQVTPNVPAPSAAEPDPVRLRPNEPVDAVIEVPAGWAAANHVATGDRVEGL